MKKTKTSLDIPDNLLKDLLSFTKAKTKSDAIITAITEYNQRYRSQKLTRFAGKLTNLMTQSELRKLRDSAE
jgi:metal-responsive CopG/Arc/MetJ family transcriptional regulator